MNDEITGQPADAAAATDTSTTAAAPAPEATTEAPAATDAPAADAAPTTETTTADAPAGEAPTPVTTDNGDQAETESPTSLAARVAALEDFMHKLGTAVTADIAALKVGITAEAKQAEGVLASFEGWLKNIAEKGVRSVEHLFGGNAE